MAVNRFSPGCECCDTGCTRLADNATSGSISSVWNNSDTAWQATSNGYENTTTSGVLWSNRAMNTTDKKGSLQFRFKTLDVGSTLKIYFDYLDSNNHHYLEITRTADESCTYTDNALTTVYNLVIGKVSSGTASTIASRTGVRGAEPDNEHVCLQWTTTHVLVHTTITVDPVWTDEAAYWNCEPSGFGLTTKYTTFEGADYGFDHSESSSSTIKIFAIAAIKSAEEENCPSCYLDCPCDEVPDEFDVTISGIADSELRFVTCSNCSNLNDTYTLTLQPDNYEKWPHGVNEWVNTRDKPANYFAEIDYASGNCVYVYSADGHSSPPSGSCNGSDVYVSKMVLWFTGKQAHLQVCLYTGTPFGTSDDFTSLQHPFYPLQLMCNSGAGARISFSLSDVSGGTYSDCMLNLSGKVVDTYWWTADWGRQIESQNLNSGRTCSLLGLTVNIVGS
tara:strand:+ start:191 stop:1534 length:1344 start_codon:yes stop_codon:yes gene_type:complete